MHHEQEYVILFEGMLCIPVLLWNFSKNVNSSLELWTKLKCSLVDPCTITLRYHQHIVIKVGAVELPRN